MRLNFEKSSYIEEILVARMSIGNSAETVGPIIARLHGFPALYVADTFWF
jgi:hypothetical protein